MIHVSLIFIRIPSGKSTAHQKGLCFVIEIGLATNFKRSSLFELEMYAFCPLDVKGTPFSSLAHAFQEVFNRKQLKQRKDKAALKRVFIPT